MFEKVKTGLALGAGGARGLAHIGVLKALEKAGIKIDYIAGSSIGALIGAGYAIAGNCAELEKRLSDFINGEPYAQSGLRLLKEAMGDKPETFSRRIETWLKRAYLQAKFVSSPAILDSDAFREIIDAIIPNVNIEDLPIPFQAMGTDLATGRPVLFKTGPLRAAVYASSAIPGIVRPLAFNDHLIVDGGVVTMVPVIPARHMGADVVLAVDVDKFGEPDGEFSNALDIMLRVEDVQNRYIQEMQLKQADLVVSPGVGHIHWSDFPSYSELIQLGQDEAQNHLDEINRLMSRRKRPQWMQKHEPPVPAREWIVI